MDAVLHKLGFLFTGVLVLGGLAVLVLLVFAAGNILSDGSLQGNGAEQRSGDLATQFLDGPNVVADSIASVATGAERTVRPVGDAIGGAFSATVSGIATAGKFVGNTVYSGVAFAVRTIVAGAVFVFHIPSNIVGFFTNTSANALIQPSNGADVPVIEARPSAVLAAHTTVATGSEHQQHDHAEPVWPVRGRVTTLFGVPHWPWQPTHTGIDISSGRVSGVTPIKPYKPGRVVDVVHSAYGLGNHVIVDHGGGVTSVYAHLHSIAVQAGQEVNRSTTLGREGSTGASTGTHLHFEIRKNGHPTNPSQYLHGNPHP